MMELTRRNQKRSEWRSASAIIVVCLLLVLGGSFLNNTFGRIALVIVSPFLRLGNQLTATIQNADSLLRSKQVLVIENDKLKQRLVELEASLADHQVIEVDNRLLRQEISLVQNEPKITVAEILSHPWNSPFDIVLTAVPDDSEIKLGSRVTFKKNVWAGTVIGKAGAVAKIKLISAPGSQVPILIGSNKVPALASGKGNGNLEVKLPRNLELKKGDLALASGTITPLMIGIVGAVDNDPNESLQTVLIRTPINLSFVHYLEIHAE